jgi:hypothetical protein
MKFTAAKSSQVGAIPKPNQRLAGPNWQLPHAKDQVTFLDHNFVIYAEGYPLCPNNNTTYVLLPDVEIKNFGKVGFSKTTSFGTTTNKKWKMIHVYCLGVLVCDYAGPPPTGTGKIDEYLAT